MKSEINGAMVKPTRLDMARILGGYLNNPPVKSRIRSRLEEELQIIESDAMGQEEKQMMLDVFDNSQLVIREDEPSFAYREENFRSPWAAAVLGGQE